MTGHHVSAVVAARPRCLAAAAAAAAEVDSNSVESLELLSEVIHLSRWVLVVSVVMVA